MGASFTSLHLRGDDRDAAIAGLRISAALPAYVSKPSAGWISAYPFATEGKGPEKLEGIAQLVSASLRTAVLGILVREGDVFFYALCEDGKTLDRYSSRPASPEPPQGGAPETLLRFCKPGIALAQVGAALRHRQVGRTARSPEEQRRYEKEMKAQKKALRERYPDICRELQEIGLPVPTLEQVLAQLDAVEDAGTGRSGGASTAEEQAASVAALLGLPGQRALRGFTSLRDGEPAPGALARPVTS